MQPRNILLRVFILGIATGIGAAIAYLWGYLRTAHKQTRPSYVDWEGHRHD